MDPDRLTRLKSWFEAYARSFLTGDADTDGPLALKIDHTARVCRNIHRIGQAIGLTDAQLMTADAVALLHDIGRFTQYRRFGTFNDRQSANHATLGIDALAQAAAFNALPPDAKRIIVDAIRYHNVRRLPTRQAPESALFRRLIRDADKLDIWRVFADCYRHRDRPDSTVVLNLPDRPTWNVQIIRSIANRQIANLHQMQSLNDFKLLQLSWVFDINFTETLIQASNRGHLGAIARSLPDAPAVQQAVGHVMERLAQAVTPQLHGEDNEQSWLLDASPAVAQKR